MLPQTQTGLWTRCQPAPARHALPQDISLASPARSCLALVQVLPFKAPRASPSTHRLRVIDEGVRLVVPIAYINQVLDPVLPTPLAALNNNRSTMCSSFFFSYHGDNHNTGQRCWFQCRNGTELFLAARSSRTIPALNPISLEPHNMVNPVLGLVTGTQHQCSHYKRGGRSLSIRLFGFKNVSELFSWITSPRQERTLETSTFPPQPWMAGQEQKSQCPLNAAA